MRPRRLGYVAMGIALALLGEAAGQQPKLRRVGFLAMRSRPESLEADFYGEVPRGLRELGYVEGKDLVVEWRFAGGDYARLPALVSELAALPVDVIVTDGTPGTKAALKSTASIPIVFAAAADPVGDGLVQSLAHPGGRATGCALLLNDTSVKEMELLRSIVPGLSRVGVLWNPGNPSSSRQVEMIKAAAPKLGIAVLAEDARTPEEIDTAFRSMTAGFREYTDAGGLMSYGINRRENYHRASTYVDKILKGASPGDLPVEQPTKVELVINRNAAKALALTIPPELLVQADKVID